MIRADVAQLLFCTLKETIKMAGTLNFKELGVHIQKLILKGA